jgi:phenylacetaldehyde dehydrogenase
MALVVPAASAETNAFIETNHDLYIGGKWVPSASRETFAVLDPASGHEITRSASGAALDVDHAVAAAKSAFESGPWAQMTGLQRGILITRLAARIEELADELAEIEAIDCGKPVTYARAVDVNLTARIYHYMAGWASKVSGETVSVSTSGDFHAYTLREPVGVVAAITPWNHPLVLTAYKLAPLLAVGCTAVLKPSELAPLSMIRLAQIAQEVGFPPGVINVVTGLGDAAGAALAGHNAIDGIAFTGSTATGKKIAAAATGNLKKVSLELGGKAPMIVFPDADLDAAIPGLASAAFFHQGQVCTSGTRLYVHRSIHDEVVEGIVAESQKLVLGHGLDTKTTMGPLISSDRRVKVLAYVAAGVADGADLVAGGLGVDGDGFFMEPTILSNTNESMSVMREEIFGPVLCVQSFTDEDIDELARKANDTVYGLSASVWTSNVNNAHKMAQRIKAGSVWINTHNFYDPALPFGGYKQSGWGREEGSEAIRMFTEVKSVCAALT